MTARDRFAGLPRIQVERLHAAARAIRDGQLPTAETAIAQVLGGHPSQPEALRLLALLRLRQQRAAEARVLLLQALGVWPGDAVLLGDLGSAHAACGDLDAAFEAWRSATAADALQPWPWFNLGRNLQAQGRPEEALAALAHATRLAPELVPAHVLSGDAALHMGELDAAASHYRAALAQHPACGDAWRGLSNIKTVPLGARDRERLVQLLDAPAVAPADRIAMGHALGKALEDAGDHAAAFDAFVEANALQRSLAPWSAEAFHRFLDVALAATTRLPGPLDPDLGSEVIFIVGMPRSGSTLYEQILSAHPQVEAASELPDLNLLIHEESHRRRRPFPDWIPALDAQDWHRLGREYLARTSRWRRDVPRFTDKMPENWKFAGVLRAMLPGAIVLEPRRDALETAWSCFKQQFYQQPHFSCDFTDLAIYLRGCEHAMDAWRARDPQHIHLLRYEALLADPEARIRELLAVCRLGFDPACLDSHRSVRNVRTASAAQVRQPLLRDTSRSSAYGSLLDPLRAALSAAARL